MTERAGSLKAGFRSFRRPPWLLRPDRFPPLASAPAVAALVFVVRVVGAAVAYLSQVLFARWMGRFEYGTFVYAWTWVIMVGGLADLGFATAAVRFIPLYRSNNDQSLIRGFLLTASWFPIVCGGVISLAFLTVVYLSREALPETEVKALYIACLCIPLFVMASVQDGVARSHHWMMVGVVPEYIIRPLALLALGSTALLFGIRLDAVLAMSVALTATALGVLAQRVALGRRLSYSPGETRFEFRRWRTVSLPILAFVTFYLALTNVDVVMLNLFRGPEEVAVYFAASKTFALVAFVSFAVSTVAAARISELFARGQSDQIEHYLAQAIRWTFWPSLAGAALILAVGRPLLSLFGPDFVDGYDLMFIMVVGLIAQASTGPAEAVLNMQGQQKACAQVYAVSFGFGLLGCALLIPLLGARGAAAAISFSLVVKSLLLFIVVKRRLSLHAFILKPSSLMR